MEEDLLEIKNLVIQFRTETGTLTAVDGVSFSVKKGERLGLVGESGCGKSVTSMSILGLNPKQNTLIPEGEILFEGKNLLGMGNRELRKIRGREISVIFQDSLTGLDPVKKIGSLLVESIRIHDKSVSRRDAWQKGIKILQSVGIPEPEKRMHEYAHQLSGGMRQRVMIGMSLLHNTKLIIADEPTTALDVTIQAQILELLNARIEKKKDHSLILITHDMGVVAEMTDRIAVMYAGKIVEMGSTEAIFTDPMHPYTRGLLKSIPRLDQDDEEELFVIQGTVPLLGEKMDGCAFCNRCPFADVRCSKEKPSVYEKEGHTVCCWKYTAEKQVKEHG